MMRINSMRLQRIYNNYTEILSELEEDSILYSEMTEEDKYYKQVSNSFRNNMKEMYTVFEDYLAFSLSSVGVAVTDKRLRDYLNNAHKLNLLPDDFYEFYDKTINIRNTFSHQYKKPSTKELVKLYTSNKEILTDFNKFMGDRLSELIKNNRRDLLSLYDE